ANSVFALTNTTGQIVVGYQYDAYGQPTQFLPGPDGVVDFGGDDVISVGSATTANPYLFTGQRFDQETGLYYFKYRYYSPELGRFITRDPVGYEAGVNRYAYVNDRPTNYVDPLGWDGELTDNYIIAGTWFDDFLAGLFGGDTAYNTVTGPNI